MLGVRTWSNVDNRKRLGICDSISKTVPSLPISDIHTGARRGRGLVVEDWSAVSEARERNLEEAYQRGKASWELVCLSVKRYRDDGLVSARLNSHLMHCTYKLLLVRGCKFWSWNM